MEITNENFQQNLSLIKESILTAEFIAIDTEFSGFQSSQDDKPHDYDTVEERYQKIKYNVQRYLAFQVGLCTFHWIEKDKKYVCRPFCFYVYPRSKIGDNSHMMQSSAISFLVNNQFDFNKLFNQSISFAQLNKLEEIKEKCMKKASNLLIHQRQLSLLSITHQMRLQEIMAQIEEWVYDCNGGDYIEFDIESYNLKKALSKELTKQYISRGVFADFDRNSTKTIVKKSKGFKQRNFIRGHTNIAESQDLSQVVLGFQDDEIIQKGKKRAKKSTSTKGSVTPQQPVIVQLSEEQKAMSQLSQQLTQQAQGQTYWNTAQKTEAEIQSDYEQLLNEELGFSTVIQLIIDSKRPIIGHNMMFDACYIFNQFIDNLPMSYNDFRQLWVKYFPLTYDTKILSEQTKQFGKSELQYLFQKCKKDKKFRNNVVIELDIEKDEQFGIYNTNGNGSTQDELKGQNHDAGYDAFNTGFIFIAVCKYIEIGKVLLPSQQQQIAPVIPINVSQQTDTTIKRASRSASKKNNTKQEPEEPPQVPTGKTSSKKIPKRKDSLKSEIYNDIELQDLLGDNDIVKEEEVKVNNKKIPVSRKKLIQLEEEDIIIEEEVQQNQRPKHYFMVQNKPIYYPDMEEFKNKIMLNRGIPRYFHLTEATTQAEQLYLLKIQKSVIQLTFKDKVDLNDIGILFSTYGDVNIVKVNDFVAYVEFTYFDAKKVKTREITELIKILKQFDRSQKVKMFEKILPYDSAIRFSFLMEVKISLFKDNQKASQILLSLGLVSLTSLALYKLYCKIQQSREESQEAKESINDQFLKFYYYNQLFPGISGVFSNETEDEALICTAGNQLKKYYLPHGIPNLGNTCYMNALLQSLTGCQLFMDYTKKLWNNITPVVTDNDSIIVFKLLAVVIEMSKGNPEVVPSDLYQLMCENFTTHEEQMDSHELLIYLQERITKIAAMHLRKMTYDQGLASSDLLSISTKTNSTIESNNETALLGDNHENLQNSLEILKNVVVEFEESPLQLKETIVNDKQLLIISQEQEVVEQEKPCKVITGRLLKGVLQFKELSTNKKLGLNPFAGVYMSTIQCVNCGPEDAIHRWEVFYDLSVDMKKNIYHSLEQFFKSEQIEDYTCMKCSLRTYIANNQRHLSNASLEFREVFEFLQKMEMIHDLDTDIFSMLLHMIVQFSLENEWSIFKRKSNITVTLPNIDLLKTRITKKFSIANAPKILCIHLKRVSYSVTGQMVLNTGAIEYPEILDLSLLQSNQTNSLHSENKYQLSAVIQHFGSAYGGHYIAYKKLFPIKDSREGPINYGWNLRFFVLDELNQDLTYYQNEEEVKPNGTIHLVDALISNITLIKEREHSFSIQTAPPNGKTYFLSCNTQEESNEWRDAIIAASTKHKIHMAQASFNSKIGPKDKFSAGDRISYAGAWKKDDDIFDENMLLNDENSGNFFDIQKVKRNTQIGAPKQGHNTSGFLGSNYSPEQPLRLSKFKGSPKDFTPVSDNMSNDSVDEKSNMIKHRALGNKKLYNKSKLGAKLDMGQMTLEQAQFLKQVQEMIQEDQGLKPMTDHWEPVTLQNGVQIFAQNPKSHRVLIDKKQLKAYVKVLALTMVALYVLKHYIGIDIDYLYIGIILQIVNFKNSNGILSLQSKYKMLKARTLVQGDQEQIGNEILRCYKDNHQDSFDYMTINVREQNRDEEKHILTTDETLDLPSDYVVRQFLERRQMKMLTYWCQDESGNFYILRKSLNQPSGKGKFINNIQEAFVCVPIDNNKSEKCVVYYFSDFNYGDQGPKVIMNSFLQDKIKVMRMGILSSLVQYQKYLNEKQIKHVYQVTREVQLQISGKPLETFDAPLFLAELEDDGRASSNQGDQYVEARHYRGSVNARIMGEAGGQLRKIKENSRNVYVKPGQRFGISDRFPGYFRLETGALWCQNQEELSSQSGIFMEVLQTAGKKLMEGRGIVAVSLPVRIFEKRSTVERICDLWCTGPIFLKKAAIESLVDPLERMKQVITFVVSGMHQVASQRKPFNPIIGETFEGLWPDGSRVYVEHVSHHPPISCFLVENIDGLYTLEGSYEYTARVTDLGNSVTGRQVGKNRVRFADGSYVEWEYPVMRISGLIFGKRTTTWLGQFEFLDKKNQLKAKLEFSKEGGFFTKQSLPIDCIEGSISKSGQEVCKIQGSWLEFLRFDDKLYWELETCDTVRPVAVDKCLPSDCRYREDSIAFGEGDLDKAQSEKERLEELQRKDRRLREQLSLKKQGIRLH